MSFGASADGTRGVPATLRRCGMTERNDEPDDLSRATPPADDCSLPLATQRRNILLYGLLWALYYLSAPITYVGITHAHILKRHLATTDFLANLPASAYLWVTALPAIIVAWLFPQPRMA